VTKADILIIGGGAAGMSAAMAAGSCQKDKRTVLVRATKQAIVPCAIPYIFASLEGPEEIVVPDAMVENFGVEIVVAEVTGLDVEKKVAVLDDGQEIAWDKLILATGSGPSDLPIPGLELEGCWTIQKDVAYLSQLREAVLQAEKIAIIGCGFIGAELADELSKLPGKEIHGIDILDNPLAAAFDPELCDIIADLLRGQGVNLHLGRQVKRVLGSSRVEGVELDDGSTIDADLVIVSVGARPNTKLAEVAGLRYERGGIWVDEYTRTSHPDVFAVGDCAIKRDFFTRRRAAILLASTASAEARTAVANLYALRVVKVVKGTLAAFTTYIGGMAFGVVGMTERRAREEGFDVVVGHSKSVNRHPGKLPGAQEENFKLVFARDSGLLLGGEVWGSQALGETLTAINVAVQGQVSVSELEALQYATHPWLTASPVGYPFVIAAQDALSQLYSSRK